MLRYLLLLLVLFSIILILYFSWLPNPDLGQKTNFPTWLGRWTNEYGNLRTAIPFIFLGALLEIGFVSEIPLWPKRLTVLAFLLALVIVAELGQILLPLRHFDVSDIAWGLVGSTLGLAMGVTGKKMWRAMVDG